MSRPPLDTLEAFATIARLRSFRKAADALGVSPSTLSHAMRGLERDLGVRLLHRTTRSVAPTEAGEHLAKRLGGVLEHLDEVLDELNAFRETPAGVLRINASEPAARVLMQSVVPTFLARHPQLALDLVTEGRLVDIVAEGFDAGVRLGEALPQDMVAVRVGGPVRFVAVASPAYLAARGAPETPDDLGAHTCIRVRLPSGNPYRWEFAREGIARDVEVHGALILDHVGLMVEAAADGLGIAYVPERAARPWLDDGRLAVVLDDWSPEIAGLYLYYPAGRIVPTALRAFVDVLKETMA